MGIDPIGVLRPYLNRARHVLAKDVEVFLDRRNRGGCLQVKQLHRHSATIIPRMTTHLDHSRAETQDDFWHPGGPAAGKACSRAFGPPASTAANHESQHG